MSVQQTSAAVATAGQEVAVSITVNGVARQASVEPRALLSEFLRETLGLTGTKVGCETGQCGACVVLLDGASVKSCAVLAVQADGAEVTTVEGLAANGTFSALQNAFWEKHGVQCGYCTGAILLSMTDLLKRTPTPTEAEIRSWMDGTLCRCGVYQNVVTAVQSVAGTASQA
jgi:aerobic carbon-monoxide dehydrogenase small subunit